ncbi:MAG: hypothetical protein FD187_3166, partial [bacterium]
LPNRFLIEYGKDTERKMGPAHFLGVLVAMKNAPSWKTEKAVPDEVSSSFVDYFYQWKDLDPPGRDTDLYGFAAMAPQLAVHVGEQHFIFEPQPPPIAMTGPSGMQPTSLGIAPSAAGAMGATSSSVVSGSSSAAAAGATGAPAPTGATETSLAPIPPPQAQASSSSLGSTSVTSTSTPIGAAPVVFAFPPMDLSGATAGDGTRDAAAAPSVGVAADSDASRAKDGNRDEKPEAKQPDSGGAAADSARLGAVPVAPPAADTGILQQQMDTGAADVATDSAVRGTGSVPMPDAGNDGQTPNPANGAMAAQPLLPVAPAGSAMIGQVPVALPGAPSVLPVQARDADVRTPASAMAAMTISTPTTSTTVAMSAVVDMPGTATGHDGGGSPQMSMSMNVRVMSSSAQKLDELVQAAALLGSLSRSGSDLGTRTPTPGTQSPVRATAAVQPTRRPSPVAARASLEHPQGPLGGEVRGEKELQKAERRREREKRDREYAESVAEDERQLVMNAPRELRSASRTSSRAQGDLSIASTGAAGASGSSLSSTAQLSLSLPNLSPSLTEYQLIPIAEEYLRGYAENLREGMRRIEEDELMSPGAKRHELAIGLTEFNSIVETVGANDRRLLTNAMLPLLTSYLAGAGESEPQNPIPVGPIPPYRSLLEDEQEVRDMGVAAGDTVQMSSSDTRVGMGALDAALATMPMPSPKIEAPAQQQTASTSSMSADIQLRSSSRDATGSVPASISVSVMARVAATPT